MSRFDNIVFTARMEKALTDAHLLRRKRKDRSVGPEHLFLSIDETGVAAYVLKEFGHKTEILKREFKASVSSFDDPLGTEPPFSNRASAVFDCTEEQASSLRHKYVGDEHLLIALLAIDSVVSQFLHSKDLSAKDAKEQVKNALG